MTHLNLYTSSLSCRESLVSMSKAHHFFELTQLLPKFCKYTPNSWYQKVMDYKRPKDVSSKTLLTMILTSYTESIHIDYSNICQSARKSIATASSILIITDQIEVWWSDLREIISVVQRTKQTSKVITKEASEQDDKRHLTKNVQCLEFYRKVNL